MFRIYDGREAFYQWDLDRQIAVDDRSIVQVHFCNRTGDCALVCECYDLNGTWVANVPNVLLQDSWRLRVYAYDGNATRYDACYDIIARSKPDTYVYTETEVLTFEKLEAQIALIQEDIGQAVADYLAENPIEAAVLSVNGMTGDVVIDTGVSQKYVDDAISTIELTPGPQGPQGIPGNDGKDGKDGQPGEPGKDGKDGYTPVKGVDYFDGAPGTPGKDGQNGQDGKTPVKGTDYWTDADRAAMVADVVAALPVYNGEVV